jgi:hypothetical protein
MATKKAASTAMTVWEKKFGGYAKESAEQVKNVGGGVGVKFRRGSIEVGGLPVKDGALECIVVGSCALNTWYAEAYDPENAQPPDCYAFALIQGDSDMAPHADAADKQSEQCADCPQNQFGTATIGRGKACGNNVRLGLILSADVESGDDVKSAEMATAKVSPTNVKHWASYVKQLKDEHGRPPWAVVTEITSHDDAKTQIRLEFKLVELIDDPGVLDALEARYQKVQDVLQQPFGPPVERVVAKPGKKPAAAVGRGSKFAAKGRR